MTIQPGQRIDLIQAEVDGCGQNSITAGLYGVFLGSGLDHPLYSFNFPGPGSPAGDEFTFDGCDPDSEDDPTECINNEGGSSAPCCGGMPVWRVSEPKISLWLEDEPLGYQPAAGPRVSARLAFKQREFDAGLSPKVFSVGKRWNFSWYSFVTFDPQGNTVVHFPSGRKRTFSSGTEYLSNTHLTGDTNTGFTVTSPDGSKQVYGLLVTNPPGSFVKAYLTESWNQQGQKTTLYYSAVDPAAHVIRLQYVVDGDNRTNTLYYVTNTYSENLISRIVDPFGRTNSYLYHTNGFLTNVTDVAGLSTSFIYDDVGWITNMTTPYGTTSFKITDTIGTAPNGRSVLVTQPDGGHHLYLYTNGAPGISSSYSSVEIPVTTPFSNKFDTNQLDLRNSFHWAPRQYANLSTTTIAAMTANDFRLASMKHWLNSVTNTFGATMIGHTLSLQRDPSPDNGGATEGEKIWHDYAGKTNSQYEGTQFLPLLVGRVLPDGSTSFTRTDRNSFGAVMTEISTYSAGGGVSLRTNTFTYAANDIDLLAQTNALGVQIVSNTYNTAHQILTNVNALSETNIYTYNANHQVTGITRPTGLITTNIYDANGLLTNTFDFAIISASPVYYRTNTYTYTNDLVFTHTDERGLTTTNVYDNLQRLTNSSDLRGATKYFYTNLDLTKVIDKLGFTNIFVYDEMRRKIYETNALGYATIYTYCNCGSLDSIQDAAGNVTLFRYDNQARLTNVVYPDLFAMTNRYDLLGRVTNSIDSAGTSTTNWFNNQGLLVAVSNAFGQVSSSIYDALDRATNTTDANGVTTSMTYDNLDRLRTRTFPDSGVESMGYTANTAALTSYTNQIANVTRYVYDPLGRKTFQTNANIEATQFSYGPASDLLSLTDGKNQVTTWNYDQYGRATNKVDAAANVIFVYAYDANNRLTSRLTPAKGTTAYAYDQLGNLTNIDYPASPDISLAYDVLSRLTNMVDSVGTNKYSYDAASQLLTEDGPWTDDTVSYTNLNRLRKGLSLLQPSGSPWTNGYAYDAARRLTNVTSPAGAFGYAYDAPRSTLVRKLSLPNGANITNSFDSVSRLLSTTLKTSGGALLNSHSYGYNPGNQRTQQVFAAGNYVNYGYDPAGQLTSALGKEPGGTTNRLQERFGYTYDAAGNLNWRTNNALIQRFNVNNLNELTTATNSGTLTVAGDTSSAATNVTVNTSNAVRYTDNTFASTNHALADGNNTFTAIASDAYGQRDTNTLTVNLPATNIFVYDLNGNLRTNGTQILEWDDENELISVTVSNAWRSEFAYDGKMRRRIRREYTWLSSAWHQTNEVHYLYDGNLAIQERDGSNVPQVTYTRGRDLSGSLQGAGGIGGLLARSQPSASTAQTAFYFCEGSGNITCLINTNQLIVAKYVYGPFADLLSQSGPLAEANLYRFSSKESGVAPDLIHYLLRYYVPSLQRWISRDPLAEALPVTAEGNETTAFRNSPVSRIDPDGASSEPSQPPGPDPSESECSKFPWWNSEVGHTGLDCQPQLTAAGKQAPKPVQGCVLQHEGVHAAQCKEHGKTGYGLMCIIPQFAACAEAQAYMRSLSCANSTLQDHSLDSKERLAVRCYKMAASSSEKAYSKRCQAWTKRPVPSPK